MSIEELCDKLGVGPFATPSELKVAYRRLASVYHPDKQGGDEEKFKEIAEAYDVLSDDYKRALHNLGSSALALARIFPKEFIIDLARTQEAMDKAGGPYNYDLLNLGRIISVVSNGTAAPSPNGIGHFYEDDYSPILSFDLDNLHVEKLWTNRYLGGYFASVEIEKGVSSRLLYPISGDLHDVVGMGADIMKVDVENFSPVNYFLKDYFTGKHYHKFTFMSQNGYSMAQNLKFIDDVVSLPEKEILHLVDDSRYFGKINGFDFVDKNGRDDLLKILFGNNFESGETGIRINKDQILNDVVKGIVIDLFFSNTLFAVKDYLPNISFPQDDVHIENAGKRFVKNISSHGVPAIYLADYDPELSDGAKQDPNLWSKIRLDNVSRLNSRVPPNLNSWKIVNKNKLNLVMSAYFLARSIVDIDGLFIPVNGFLE